MVKIQVWASRRQGRETRAKYWPQRLLTFQQCLAWWQTSNTRPCDIRSQKHGIKGGSGCLLRYIRKEWENMVVIFSLDTFPRRITNWGQQFIKSHHKMQSSSVLSLSPPGLVRPSGRAWGELLFHIWPPHLTPAVWWTRWTRWTGHASKSNCLLEWLDWKTQTYYLQRCFVSDNEVNWLCKTRQLFSATALPFYFIFTWYLKCLWALRLFVDIYQDTQSFHLSLIITHQDPKFCCNG